MSSRAQSRRSQRGRAVQQKNNSQMRIVYIVLAIVAIAVVALFASRFLGGNSAAAPSGDLSSYPSKGKADAPVTVIEYADFQCPGCAAFATTQEAQITKDYVDTGKVRMIYHEFPLTNIHQNATVAAEAGRCAADQGKFWPMHDLLFANQRRWESLGDPKPEFSTYAASAGLNTATFDQCLSSGKFLPTVQAAEADAQKAQINETPTFVINGKTYKAATMRQGIEDALAGKQ